MQGEAQGGGGGGGGWGGAGGGGGVLVGAGLAGAAGGFQVVASPSVPGASLAGIGFVSATDGWTVGSFTGPNRHDGRAPLTEHWNGSAWSAVGRPTPSSTTTR